MLAVSSNSSLGCMHIYDHVLVIHLFDYRYIQVAPMMGFVPDKESHKAYTFNVMKDSSAQLIRALENTPKVLSIWLKVHHE